MVSGIQGRVTGAVEAITLAAHAAEDGTSCVIATDTSGTIVYWNEHAARVFGWTEEEALSRNVVDVTPTMHSTTEAERIMHELNRGNSWSGRFLVRHRDGTPIVISVTDVPVIHDGAVVGIVGVSEPVS
jgi:PAS domain S-box-containing protein